VSGPGAGTGESLADAVGRAAGAVAAVLAEHPPRARGHYPIATVLDELIRQHEVLRTAVDAHPAPPGLHPLGAELAALMSLLQLLRVLYLRLDDIPDAMRVTAARNLASTHLAARRVRDRARR
jgi:hypothetical protein